ncbi:MAG: hypothetical protein COV45_05380 [Deltaproteobacteria bacterium CG11_big_fil_rev_8_21_14_0_20_47_16]|nr:MAG: hypothetical protein COV45_05380 [Deltaproteobacteria bacterium CG11_big_fil_rev_8_21_14_0_20_47_16]
MQNRLIIALGVWLGLFAFVQSTTLAQTSANIPLNDPSYDWVQILIGAGLIKSDFPEQRPWSALEFARLIKEAEKNFEIKQENDAKEPSLSKFTKAASQNRFLKKIFSALHSEFRDTLDERHGVYVHPLEVAYGQYMYLGENPTLVAPNGLDPISGEFHPFYWDQEGRHYVKGNNFDLQTRHSLQLGKYVSVFGRPQIEVTVPTVTGIGSSINIYAKTLAAKVGWKNVELEVGRDQLVWGSAQNGGVLFSNNPRGLDMIELDTPYPFHLPWALKKLGSYKLAVFLSNLGPQYSPERPWITGLQFVWHIIPSIRLGFNHELTFGGQGYPTLPPGDVILETIGFPMATGNPLGGGYPTNRSYTFSGGFRIPSLRNIEFATQIYFEDISFGDLGPVPGHYLTYFGNLRVPRLTNDGRLSLYAEYEYVGSRPYRHIQYFNGWTLNREFLAHTFGPDTQFVRTDFRYTISPYSWGDLNLLYIRRLSDIYKYVSDGTGSGRIVDIVTVSSGPKEQHYMAIGEFHVQIAPHWQLYSQAGLDWIQNANFVQGQTAQHGLFKLGLMWRQNMH